MKIFVEPVHMKTGCCKKERKYVYSLFLFKLIYFILKSFTFFSFSRKPNRRSPSLNVIEAASANNPPSNDVTVIGYSYGRHAVPYLSKMPGKNITLRQFKSMLSKKGNFRYVFYIFVKFKIIHAHFLN